MRVPPRPLRRSGIRLASAAVLLLWTVACLRPEPPAGPGCADCHGAGANPAPPTALGGLSDPTSRGVGAHQVHVEGVPGAAPVACAECHAVPASLDAPGHVDTSVPAEVRWENGTIAQVGAAPYAQEDGTCTVWCHSRPGAAVPVVAWTALGSVGACGDCHGAPPPPPHPAGGSCADCHGGGPDDPERHVDGVVDLLGGTVTETGSDTGTAPAPAGCAEGCHGTASTPAPPPDTLGNVDPSAVGVGAHAAHLAGAVAVAVPCDGCHTVPATPNAPGHLGDDPGDDLLSGLAAQGGRSPEWRAASATCAETYCHDQGGSTPEPTWTGGAIGCGSCHGAPPPPPHDPGGDCAACHGHAGDDPVRHLDGTVQR